MDDKASGEGNHSDRPGGLLRTALVGVSFAALVAVVLLIVARAANVFLLIFAGVLFAIPLRKTADWVTSKTTLTIRWSITAVFVLLFLLLGVLFWFLGPNLIQQAGDLGTKLPEAVEGFKSFLEQYVWGEMVLEVLPSSGSWWTEHLDTLFQQIQNLASFFLAAFIVLFTTLFITINPSLYTHGIIALVPPRRRSRAREVLQALGNTLQWWVVGRLADMVIVGLLTGTGLWLLGIPLVFTLALIAGLLVFIPVIGPILSALPAILVAFLVGPMHALYVGLLYLGIQQVESNLILPPIQRYMISLPPVLLILAMTVMYKLAGILGLFLAAPLTATVIVVVRMVYVADVLETGQASPTARRP